MGPLPNAERLLAESAWLRALSARLAGDADAALDLQQDVAVAALTQPEAPVGRSWLAAVARNLAITLRRRRSAEARRLRAVEPREPAPSAAELAATAELQQRAVAAVLALPHAYRDTVLLRFMQGLSLLATAQAMGVPEETVRTRQKRALALLRQQLAPPRRDRRSSLAALLPPLVAAGVAVKVKPFAVAAVALLFVALAWATLSWREAMEPGVPQASGIAAAAAGVAAPRDESVVEMASSPREAVASAVDAPAPSRTAQLRVRVRWHDGAPAAGVALLCVAHWTERTIRTTDDNGEVVFEDLGPGDYSVEAGDFTSESVQLAAGDDQEVALTLRPSTRLAGVVVDANGMPVPFAELLQSMPGCAPQWTMSLGLCDAAGRFAVRVSAQLLGARAAGRGLSDFLLLTQEDHFAVAPKAVTLRLLAARAAVRGHVVDDRGQPVAGAWVQLGRIVGELHPDAAGALWQEPPPVLLTTDAAGRFVADGMRAGARDLLVHRRGLAAYRERLDLVADVPRDLEIVLHDGATLRGRVLDGAGRPVAGAAVEAEDLHVPQHAEATTGADGAFEIPGLPLGELSFRVRAAGFARAERTFDFVAGEDRVWSVTLDAGLRIVGRLVDDTGAPLAGWPLLRDGCDRCVRTDADGRFTITDCDATGNGVSVFEDWGFKPVVLRLEGLLPSTVEQRFVVPRSRWPSMHVHLRCVDAVGAPIEGAGIDLWQGDNPIYADASLLRATGPGAFDLGPLPPGDYVIAPSHRDFEFERIAVELQPGEGARELGDRVGRAK